MGTCDSLARNWEAEKTGVELVGFYRATDPDKMAIDNPLHE